MRSTRSDAVRPHDERELLTMAEREGVRVVRLVFADIFGVAKTVSIPVARLQAAVQGRITFDGGSIDGFVRGEELDMMLRPDIATFALFPWEGVEGAEARLICDIAMPDGAPFEGCPRTTLRRVLETTPNAVRSAEVALEVEFYLFERAAPRSISTPDVASYFDFPADDRGEDARVAIGSALERMGIAVASLHHEHGAGQHEIDLSPLPPLEAADALLTLRTIAKHVAPRFGLDATFMPKPLEDRAGSGLHVEWLLNDEDDARYVVGGLLAHAPAMTAVCNATVNSYKRLVAAWDAPIHAVWSRRSANAFARIPEGTPRHVELRSPDPACNPYLALAVIAAAAADGIEHSILPGEPLPGSTYDLDERRRREQGIRTLPKSLRQAIADLDGDALLRAALGDHIYHAFRDAKLEEYERYRRAVHEWERTAYLRIY